MAHPQRRDALAAPVLFLDIDGVLNVATATAGAFSRLHASLLDRLARVVRSSRARVVLASSWRHDRQRLALLERAWRRAQLPPLDSVTPTLPTVAGLLATQHEPDDTTAARQRVREIQEWLQEDAVQNPSNPVRWAAVDDLDLAATAAADDQAKYIRTDPRRGLSADNVGDLVALLNGGGGDGDEVNTSPQVQRLPVAAQLLQLAVDLLVVTSSSSPSSATIVDCSDFSVITTLETTQQSLRAWLRAQEFEFSTDRIARIHLGSSDDLDLEGTDEQDIPLSVKLTTPSPQMTPQALVSAIVCEDTARDSIRLLLDAIQRRDLDEWGGSDSAVRQLINAGFAADTCPQLAADVSLAMYLVDVLPTFNGSSHRVDLAVDICLLFSQPSDRVARRILAEYVVREEITSRAALDAIRLLWTAHNANLEEVDEMLGAL